MAGFATRPSFAGHANSSATTNHELTSILDHLMGAGQTASKPMKLATENICGSKAASQIKEQ